MKTCYKCHAVLDFIFFNKSKNRKDGYNPQCKLCDKKYREINKEKLISKKAEYYLANKEKLNKYSRARYHNNPEKHLKQLRDYYSIPENRAKKLLSKTKERALKENIPFNLDLKDIIIPTHCPYLGMELTHYLGQGYLDSNSSIDRTIPELGYVKGNVQVISRLANQMKNSATKEQLITFSKNVLAMYNTTTKFGPCGYCGKYASECQFCKHGDNDYGDYP